MINLKSRAFLLVAGVIFVTSTALHPIYHDHYEDDYSVTECLACSKETSKPTEFTHSIAYSSLIDLISSEIDSPLISGRFTTFHSRAPPKN